MVKTKNGFLLWAETSLFLFLLMVLCNSENATNHACVSHYANTFTSSCLKVCSADMEQIPGNVSHPDFLSVHSFPRTPVLKVDCFHEDILKWIHSKVPVMFKNCTFFNQALKWDLDYLTKELTDEYTVSFSNSRKFLYYNTDADHQKFMDAGWTPTYEQQYHSFKQFLEIASELSKVNNGTHAYFQTLLVNDDNNSSVKDDLDNFDYAWLLHLAFQLGWSTNVINMLFVGMPNVLTPAHYDMMENLFIQVKGKKRFILLHPDQFSYLYPYPFGHPHDRHSQVDFDNPDFKRFPKFRNVEAFEAIVGPGDLLYVPTNWWHYVESNKHDFTVSLNFWFENRIAEKISSLVKESSSSKTAMYLTPAEDLAFKRYIESIVYNVTKSFTKVKEIFEDLSRDRFQF